MLDVGPSSLQMALLRACAGWIRLCFFAFLFLCVCASGRWAGDAGRMFQQAMVLSTIYLHTISIEISQYPVHSAEDYNISKHPNI